MNRRLRYFVFGSAFAACMIAFTALQAEGSKQLSPIVSSGDTSIVMLHTNSDSTGNFAEYDAPVVNRLHIRIEDFNTDTIYFGLSREYNDFGDPDGIGGTGTYCFRVKDPTGTVVHGPFSMNSGNANADSWELATRGPEVIDPLGYDVDAAFATYVPLMNGDYYIEFTDNPDCNVADPGDPVNLKFFDISVVSNGVEQTGRLWSFNWAFVSPPINPNMPPECQFDRPFNGSLFSYTTDGFVSKIDFDSSGFQGLQFNVAFGERGPRNTGDVLVDRKSVYNADSTSGAADHMVFVNDPDPDEFPSSTNVCGEVELLSVSCVADSFCFNIGVTRPGQVEIILDFDGDGVFTEDTVDVILAMMFEEADTACLAWNGLKGDSSMLEPGENLPATIRYSQGVQHYAAYDVELLKFGFCVQTIRPICPGIQTDLLHWDDSDLQDDLNTGAYDESDPGTGQPLMQLNGCECQQGGCRTWTNVHVDADTSCVGQITGYGDRSTLNTWWFANTIIEGPLDLPFVSVEIQGDSAICLGDSTVFIAAGFPDTIDYVYEWSGPNGFMSSMESTGFISDPGTYFVTITDTVAMCSAVDSAVLAVFDPPSLSLMFMCVGPNMQNVDIDLTVMGAGPPFAYEWSNGAMTEDLFDVAPGTYTVMVTDTNGCVAIDSIIVGGCCDLDIACPADAHYSCIDDVPAFSLLDVIINEFCDTVFYGGSESDNGGTGCGTDTLIITRVYSVSDGAGNSASCAQVITVADDIAPTITCPADVTVDCDAGIDPGVTGMATGTDNCSAVSITYSDNTAPGVCITDPAVQRTWIATDECGNSTSCIQMITVQDTVAPVVDVCPEDLTIDCGSGFMILDPTYSDNCAGMVLISFEDDSIGFDGSCVDQIVGSIVRTYFAEDGCGNIDSSCMVTVTVQDTTAPVVLSCPENTVVECADPGGMVELPEYSDVCSGVTITFVDDTIGFMPPDLGMIVRTFYGTDGCGNVDSSCVQTITIQDTDSPECLTMDITVSLDAMGMVSIDSNAVDNGSNDACGLASISVDPSSFDCNDVGVNVVLQTVTDVNGNSSTCSANVTVVDDLAPMCTTVDITVELDETGNATIADDAVDAGSSDNCSIISISLSQTAFGCDDVGVVIVTQTVTDESGNQSSCTASVTVVDNLAPECLVQDITVQLDDAGMAAILDDALDAGSNDNCGVDTIVLSQLNFGCDDVGTLMVTQTVIDDNGNTSTCTGLVTIEDNVAPECLTQDITVELDENGEAAILDDAVDNGSNDACGIDTIILSQLAFNCDNVGDVVVTQTVTDVNGNVSSCTATITVEDNLPPTFTPPTAVTINCEDDPGNLGLTGDVTDAEDNCGVEDIAFTDDVSGLTGCNGTGSIIRTWTVTDVNGNTATGTQQITVVDVTAPTIECPADATIFSLDEFNMNITGVPDVADNCDLSPEVDFTDNIIEGECEDMFVAERTWVVTDACGNSASCLQIITVDGECGCDLFCPDDITVNLDPGACTAIINYPDPTFEGGGCPEDITEPATLTQNTNTTLIEDALQCGVNPTSHWRAYDLAAMGVMGDFQMESLGMASWSAGTVQVFVYAYSGDLPSNTLDLAQMTLLGQANPMAVGGFSLTTHVLTAPVVIPANSKFVVEQRQTAGGPWCIASNYQGNTQPAYMNCNGSPFGFPAIPTSYVDLGFGFIHPIQQLNGSTFQQGAILVQVSGLPSGSEFPIGTTENCFHLIDANTDEVVDSCCFTVTVNEYPFSIPPACNDLVQISLDENCEAQLCADVILEGGPYGCYDDYEVYTDEYGPDVNVNCVSLNYGPGLHTVTIVDPETGNSCWGEFLIEDKLPPMLTCMDFTLTCGQDLTPVFTPPIMGVNTCATVLSPGLPIGPNAGVITTSTCTVSLPQGVEIIDVNVCVKITHTWIGDCNTDIIHPSGAVTNLWGFGQCNLTDNMHQKFDDDGPLTVLCADINDGCDFILQPVAQQLGTPSLDQYIGENPNGTWTLMVTDNANGDGGTLDEWYLEIEYAQNAPFAPTYSDNCDDNLDLTYEDVEFGDICDSIIIERTWTAVDDAGNSAQCVQTLTIEPLTLDALECPENYEGECGQSSDPDVTGWPTIEGNNITEGGFCNVFVGYWDKELIDCGNGTKIIRTWTILDWCTQELAECIQVIKLSDEEGPVLVCPEDKTVSTGPWFCNADINLDLPQAYDECGTPFTLTPSVSAGILIHFSGNNYRVDDLPLGTHVVTWSATDNCGNESTCTYTITVEDLVPPTPICDEHTVVTLTNDNGGLDEGLTKIYAETFDDGSHDNCGPVTFLARRMDSCIDFDWIGPNGEYPNNDGGLPESIDRGLTFQPWVPFACCDAGNVVMVELRVTDLYGNINSCMVEVSVQDKLPPFIECPPDISVSCEFWFNAHETNGFEASDGLEDVFGRVLDEYDYDESDRQYVIIDDPGNNELPQPYHWGLDGWADDNCDVNIDIRTRIFDDCSGDDLPSGAPDHAVRLVERTFRAQDGQGNTSTCRQRIWVVDYDPFYITDTQCGLNNADDVRWPCDLEITDCPEGELTPDNLSAYAPNNRPVVNDDNCSVIGVTYDDQIFYFVDNACYKIVRTWTVIDWCQFDPVDHTGYWTYVQVIKVYDNEGPEFSDCPDEVTLCVSDPGVTLPENNQVFLGESNPSSSACSVHLNLTHTVQDACSDKVLYDVKVYPFNGSEYIQVVSTTEVTLDSQGIGELVLNTRQATLPSNHPVRLYGLPYNSNVCSNWPLPGGEKDYHRVLWSVEDGCGNLSTCEYLLRLEDCKQPTPICVGLSSVVMPSSGSVTIWAKDFDSGSSVDDCTAHDDLLFSFSGDTYTPSMDFDCDVIEANGSPSFLVEIWVADEGNDQNCNGFVNPLGIEWGERNKDFCTTFIVIDDNEMVCDTSIGVAGDIETEDFEAVEKVRVDLINPQGQVMNSYMTNQNGTYHFINPLIDYTIEAFRNDDHKNGVSTLDLVDIQKHLLGIKPLTSPYKLIAADANNSESVSALDLVEIRKLILGQYVEYPNNTSWRFADKDFEFDDPSAPWPFDESIELQAGMSSDEDFVAIKIGDVNGTVKANATQIQTRGARKTLTLTVSDREVVAGETIEVPVYGVNFNQILGYQFTLDLNGVSYEMIESGALAMPVDYVANHGDAITTSWTNLAAQAQAADVARDEALFTLKLTAHKAGTLSEMLEITSAITDAEAYAVGEDEVETLDVALVFNSGIAQELEYALYQNEPNPFAHQTLIGFDLPEAMKATLTVFDITGRVIYTVDGDYAGGYNQVVIKSADLNATGTYYYRLDAGEFTASKKLVMTRE